MPVFKDRSPKSRRSKAQFRGSIFQIQSTSMKANAVSLWTEENSYTRLLCGKIHYVWNERHLKLTWGFHNLVFKVFLDRNQICIDCIVCTAQAAQATMMIVDLGQQQFASCLYMFFPVVDVVCFCPAYGLFLLWLRRCFFLLPVLRWFLSSRGDVLTSYSSLVVWVHWFVVACHLLFSVTLPAFVFDIVSP